MFSIIPVRFREFFEISETIIDCAARTRTVLRLVSVVNICLAEYEEFCASTVLYIEIELNLWKTI